jgi:outer membrane immunogenic protein
MEFVMKKVILALASLAAFSGSALAADLAAKPYVKAPPPVAPVYNWTGFYIFGGAGGGVWDANTFDRATGVGTINSIGQRQGGDGWFGTVGAGYDWQFNNTWVAGVFADGQFGSMRGTIQDPLAQITGTIKNQDNWAGGVRLGYLVAPNVLSYVNGGYTGSHWSGTTELNLAGFPTAIHTNAFNLNGVFFGGGVENSLDIFGIHMPGLFMKTEYRASWYNSKNINELTPVNALVGTDIGFKPFVETVETSLVYRFNWTGPAISHY